MSKESNPIHSHNIFNDLKLIESSFQSRRRNIMEKIREKSKATFESRKASIESTLFYREVEGINRSRLGLILHE